MLKKNILPLAVVYSIALAILCLISFSKFPKIKVSNADKIFHSSAYIVLAGIWYYAFFYHFKKGQKASIINSVFLSFTFGMIIEVLQEVFTTTRQADILDVLANTLGIMVFVVFILIKNRITVKKL